VTKVGRMHRFDPVRSPRASAFSRAPPPARRVRPGRGRWLYGVSVAARDETYGLDADARGAASRLLGPAEIRALAASAGIRPTKTLGQNFLHDANTIRRIVRIAAVGPDDVVLEVGPGLGSLTFGLLETVRRVTAVEIDPVLAALLSRTAAGRGVTDRLTVVTDDALSVRDLPEPAPTALVANLPYNVAVPVLLHLLEAVPTLRHGLVMVQAEVAARLAAPPGSRTYGVPSVKAAWYAEVTEAGAVPRSVFWPMPNVDSGLVRVVRRDPPALPDGVTRADVFAVIDAAFAQRRKMLRSALGGWAGSAGAAVAVLTDAGVDPAARGETLGVEAFVRIAAARARLTFGGGWSI
jgi:16S rRNA (adenine1518-N6/adenine1519-N6)-dimethyltransferase